MLLPKFQRHFREFLRDLGELSVLVIEAARSLRYQRPSCREVLAQLYFVGVRSQSVVMTTGAATGMVLCAQTFFQFHKFKMESATGAVVSVGMSSELGPVLAGLMLTARVGASMAAHETEGSDEDEVMACKENVTLQHAERGSSSTGGIKKGKRRRGKQKCQGNRQWLAARGADRPMAAGEASGS
jgi:hypothetical protein